MLTEDVKNASCPLLKLLCVLAEKEGPHDMVYSLAVTHPSANPAWLVLTLEIMQSWMTFFRKNVKTMRNKPYWHAHQWVRDK